MIWIPCTWINAMFNERGVLPIWSSSICHISTTLRTMQYIRDSFHGGMILSISSFWELQKWSTRSRACRGKMSDSRFSWYLNSYTQARQIQRLGESEAEIDILMKIESSHYRTNLYQWHKYKYKYKCMYLDAHLGLRGCSLVWMWTRQREGEGRQRRGCDLAAGRRTRGCRCRPRRSWKCPWGKTPGAKEQHYFLIFKCCLW